MKMDSREKVYEILISVKREHCVHTLNMHTTLPDKGSVHPVTAMGDYPATRAPLTAVFDIASPTKCGSIFLPAEMQLLYLPRPEPMAEALLNIAIYWPGRLTTGCWVVIMFCVKL